MRLSLFLNYLRSLKGIEKAVLENNLERVKQYLAKEKDNSCKRNKASQSLFYAKSTEMVDLLIDTGADINYTRDRDKFITPLYSAVVNHKKDITEFLLAKGAIVSPHLAAFMGREEEIEKYLAEGGYVNLREQNEITLLHMAARNNQVVMAKLLLDNDADVNAQNSYGAIPLHYAAACEEGETLVKLFIERGANLNFIAKKHPISDRKCRDGTPLHIAARYNYENIAQILIDNGANIDARDRNDYTPLHSTSISRSYEVAELLIENGADINAYDHYRGKTPLHKAVKSGDIEMVKLLIACGAEINFRDYEKNTPLADATINTQKDTNIYCLLVRCGAKL